MAEGKPCVSYWCAWTAVPLWHLWQHQLLPEPQLSGQLDRRRERPQPASPQGDQQLLQTLWTDGTGKTPFPFEKKMNQTWLLLIPQNIPVDFIFPGANEHGHLPAALRSLPLEIFFPIWSNLQLYLTLMHEPLPSAEFALRHAVSFQAVLCRARTLWAPFNSGNAMTPPFYCSSSNIHLAEGIIQAPQLSASATTDLVTTSTWAHW